MQKLFFYYIRKKRAVQEKSYSCQLRIKTALLLDDLSFKTALRVRMPPKEN
jgi:hypothetical protein